MTTARTRCTGVTEKKNSIMKKKGGCGALSSTREPALSCGPVSETLDDREAPVTGVVWTDVLVPASQLPVL